MKKTVLITGATDSAFAEVLRSLRTRTKKILEEKQAQTTELRFSKHANERLASRNIRLSTEQRERLEGGVNKASQKGIKDSLVMVDNMAFIVNITNRTVITAVGEGDDKIFTNIDGAIIT